MVGKNSYEIFINKIEDLETFVNEFRSIITNDRYSPINYSIINTLVFDCYKTGKIDKLTDILIGNRNNIESILKKIDDDDKNFPLIDNNKLKELKATIILDDRERELLHKVFNHFLLEINRCKTFYKVYDEKLRKSESILDDATNLLAESSSLHEKSKLLNEEAQNIKNQIITILGIFASIVLSVSGALSISNNIMHTIRDKSNSFILLVIFILGFIFYNSFYIFIVFMYNISGMQSKYMLFKKYNLCINIFLLFMMILFGILSFDSLFLRHL